jgi:hypothetical protein
MARRFENILETIGRTPVVKIGKLAPVELRQSAGAGGIPLRDVDPPGVIAATSTRLRRCRPPTAMFGYAVASPTIGAQGFARFWP